MSRHTRILITKSAVIVLLAALVVWWVLQHQARGKLEFPDGSKFVIRSATFSTTQPYRSGKLAPRIAAPLLSKKYKQRWGVYEYTRSNDFRCLYLLAHWSGPQTNYPPTILTFVDQSGLESEFNWAMTLPNSNPKETHLSWQCLNYPRRDKTLHLKIYQLDIKAKPIYRGALETANPWNGPFPRWNKPVSPQTNSVDGLTFVLLALAPDGVPVRGLNVRRPGLLPGHTAVFKVERNGQPSPEWRPTKVEVSDASGNTFTSSRTITDSVGHWSLLHFSGALWADEMVWKLRTTFIKQDDFAPDELLSISNVPVPELNQTVRLTNSITLQGLAGYALDFQRYQPFPNTDLPGENGRVHFRFEGTTTNRWVSLQKVSDQDGRTIAFLPQPPSGKDWPSGLQIPKESKALHFQFAIHAPVVAEFISGLESKPLASPAAK